MNFESADKKFFSNTIKVNLESETPKFASAQSNRRSKAHRRTMHTPYFNTIDQSPALDFENDPQVDDILIQSQLYRLQKKIERKHMLLFTSYAQVPSCSVNDEGDPQ